MDELRIIIIIMRQRKDGQEFYMRLADEFSAPRVIALLLENGVGAVYLFGSHVKGIERPDSDIDIGIVLLAPASPQAMREIYDNILEIITDAVSRVSSKTVDMVMLQRASLALQFEVAMDGEILFEVSPDFSLNYKEHIIKEYADFDYHRQVFNRAALEAFA